MTPDELKQAKISLNLTQQQMAFLLGYEGKQGIRQIQHMMEGTRSIRPAQARLVRAYLDGYRPDDWPESAYKSYVPLSYRNGNATFPINRCIKSQNEVLDSALRFGMGYYVTSVGQKGDIEITHIENEDVWVKLDHVDKT